MPRSRLYRANNLLRNLKEQKGEIVSYDDLERAIKENVGEHKETIRRYLNLMIRYGLIEVLDEGDTIRLKPKSAEVIKKIKKGSESIYMLYNRVKRQILIFKATLKRENKPVYEVHKDNLNTIERLLREIGMDLGLED